MPTLTKFKLQIEGVDSDDDNILYEVVEEDEAGTPPVAVTITDVVRGKRKEASSIFREKIQKQQHSTSEITTNNPKASLSLVIIEKKKGRKH